MFHGAAPPACGSSQTLLLDPGATQCGLQAAQLAVQCCRVRHVCSGRPCRWKEGFWNSFGASCCGQSVGSTPAKRVFPARLALARSMGEPRTSRSCLNAFGPFRIPQLHSRATTRFPCPRRAQGCAQLNCVLHNQAWPRLRRPAAVRTLAAGNQPILARALCWRFATLISIILGTCGIELDGRLLMLTAKAKAWQRSCQQGAHSHV